MDLTRIFTLRNHKRFMVNIDVTVVETTTGREMDGKIADVSVTGMQILSEDSFDNGTMLDIWFLVPAEHEGRAPQTIIATGKVANCALHAKGQRFEIGVSLKKFDGDSKAVYERYLHRVSGAAKPV